MAELADALDVGSSGRPWGFKSSHPHHNLKVRNSKVFKKLCYFIFYKLLLFYHIRIIYYQKSRQLRLTRNEDKNYPEDSFYDAARQVLSSAPIVVFKNFENYYFFMKILNCYMLQVQYRII